MQYLLSNNAYYIEKQHIAIILYLLFMNMSFKKFFKFYNYKTLTQILEILFKNNFGNTYIIKTELISLINIK